MSAPVAPELIARITLLPTDEGGRTGSILSGEYRGVLGVGGEHFSARFNVPGGEEIPPGETVQVGIQFLVPAVALPNFAVGRIFTVWEGREIGRGEVVEVLGNA